MKTALEIHRRLFYSPVLKRLVLPFFRPVSVRAQSEKSGKSCNTHSKVWYPILFNSNGS